ncbi:hypothetical protein BRC82_06110 [Halobacteriales archaeon QS_1_67_19]|nr:MAG: hypothetical protein BRC82_06110 [Halobacteriales archaeon QS_1_67_19]
MTAPFSYVAFLSAFVALPAAALAIAVGRRTARPRRVAAGIATLVCIAVAYTAPWDSYLIGREVWWYGAGVVAAEYVRIPLGEWLFFALQTILTGLWYHALGPRIAPTLPDSESARRRGAAVWTVVALLGTVLAVANASTYYLGMILAWAAPVAAFLWAVGGPVIWRSRRLVAAAVAVPTLYLWLVDGLAIGLGLWTIAPAYTTGFTLLGLPVEEAVFFLLTNVLVVQGLLLFDWVVARADDRGPTYAFEGLVPAANRVSRPWR